MITPSNYVYIYIYIMELNYKSAKWRGKAINVQVVIWQNNDITYDVLLTLLSGNLNYRFGANFLPKGFLIHILLKYIKTMFVARNTLVHLLCIGSGNYYSCSTIINQKMNKIHIWILHFKYSKFKWQGIIATEMNHSLKLIVVEHFLTLMWRNLSYRLAMRIH